MTYVLQFGTDSDDPDEVIPCATVDEAVNIAEDRFHICKGAATVLRGEFQTSFTDTDEVMHWLAIREN